MAAGSPGPWRPAVLVVDDEWSMLMRIKEALSDEFEVHTTTRPEQAMELMATGKFDVVLTDVRMPGMDGLSLVKELKGRYPETSYILMTAFSDIDDTISAIRLGVADYLRKPFTMSEVRHALNRCLERRRLKHQVASLRAEAGVPRVVAVDPVMRRVYELAMNVAPMDVTVLITGETGTGKGLLARAMHNNSPRRGGPFVEINCAAIPSSLIESELFGHERGAFTGAVARKRGRVEVAEGGSLLLDEVGEMPLEMQGKLLRFLQEQTFERVGGTRKLYADVRIFAASNRDLKKAVEQGLMREDLFYRLHVIHLHLPPLRERPGDILPLARHFLQRFCAKYGKEIRGFSAGARRQMLSYHWPGNVRELEHTVERAVVLCRGEVVEELEVAMAGQVEPGAGVDGGGREPLAQPEVGASLKEYLAECERRYLRRLLERYNGRIGKVAQAAGINPKTLYLKMRRYGLAKEQFRPARAGDSSVGRRDS